MVGQPFFILSSPSLLIQACKLKKLIDILRPLQGVLLFYLQKIALKNLLYNTLCLSLDYKIRKRTNCENKVKWKMQMNNPEEELRGIHLAK